MIPDEVEARLKHLAELRAVTVSEVIREALEEHVGRRRLHAAGSGSSSRGAIASRIDEVLAQEWGEGDALIDPDR